MPEGRNERLFCHAKEDEDFRGGVLWYTAQEHPLGDLSACGLPAQAGAETAEKLRSWTGTAEAKRMRSWYETYMWPARQRKLGTEGAGTRTSAPWARWRGMCAPSNASSSIGAFPVPS